MATMSATNPTQIGLESDLFQRVDRSANNHLSHGTGRLAQFTFQSTGRFQSRAVHMFVTY